MPDHFCYCGQPSKHALGDLTGFVVRKSPKAGPASEYFCDLCWDELLLALGRPPKPEVTDRFEFDIEKILQNLPVCPLGEEIPGPPADTYTAIEISRIRRGAINDLENTAFDLERSLFVNIGSLNNGPEDRHPVLPENLGPNQSIRHVKFTKTRGDRPPHSADRWEFITIVPATVDDILEFIALANLALASPQPRGNDAQSSTTILCNGRRFQISNDEQERLNGFLWSGTAKDYRKAKAIPERAGGIVAIAFDKHDVLHLASRDAIWIYHYGKLCHLAGKPGRKGHLDGKSRQARFDYLANMAFGPDGNLYLEDNSNGAVRKVTPAGDVTTVTGVRRGGPPKDGPRDVANFYGMRGIAVSSDDRLYVGGMSCVREVEADGTVLTKVGLLHPKPGEENPASRATDIFGGIQYLAMDSQNNILAIDTAGLSDNKLIRKISPQGVVTTLEIRAAEGEPAMSLANSHRMVVDSRDNIFTNCYYGIIKITPKGVMSLFAGEFLERPKWVKGVQTPKLPIPTSVDGLGKDARFTHVGPMALDKQDNLYVCEYFYTLCTLRRITPDGAVTTVAKFRPEELQEMPPYPGVTWRS